MIPAIISGVNAGKFYSNYRFTTPAGVISCTITEPRHLESSYSCYSGVSRWKGVYFYGMLIFTGAFSL